MKVKVTDYKAHQQNTLQAFVDLLIVDVGAQIKGCTLHEKNGSRWIGLPARAYEKDGETAWARIIDFPEREDYRAFQDAALAALESHLSGDGGSVTPVADGDLPF